MPGNWHGGFGGRPCGEGPAQLAPRRMVDPTDHLQDLGMGKARYQGRRKTRLQALLAATVANFKRLVVLDAFENGPAIAA